ncbi:uncharacterized protein LOC6530192 [Drosophila yakuba]|uniref:Uncharacterized protein n=1 Tax=Drosophila yakuba TaxID=7245 RepID=B4P5P5_DROYA|nr:uncharacterized protein LOC6530192 [Drosophila yakuba]EDW90842.2 uncharacterized protein Dyak_GE12405 [Drosophila yakuba]
MEQNCRSVGILEQYGRMHWKSDEQCGMLFLDCVYRNASMPSAMGDLILYVVFLVATSYAIVSLFRMVLCLVKPVLKVVIALLVIRFLISLIETFNRQ